MRQPHTATVSSIMMAPRPRICIRRSAPIAPGYPMMLRIAREVAWLSEGSCTDQVISAAPVTPDSAIRPSPVRLRNCRSNISRIDAGRCPTMGMTRSIAGILMRPRD